MSRALSRQREDFSAQPSTSPKCGLAACAIASVIVMLTNSMETLKLHGLLAYVASSYHPRSTQGLCKHVDNLSYSRYLQELGQHFRVYKPFTSLLRYCWVRNGPQGCSAQAEVLRNLNCLLHPVKRNIMENKFRWSTLSFSQPATTAPMSGRGRAWRLEFHVLHTGSVMKTSCCRGQHV